jgi:Aldehyde dehydrogenase family
VHDYAVPISFAGNAILLERFLRHFAGYVDKPHGTTTPVTGSFDINLIEREPFGVVGVITPWNGSLVVTGSCVAPALAAGNAVVLKPSEVAPFAALRFGELCVEVGLPNGLVNVVPAGSEGGDALVRHPGIRKIHFTGGDVTARKVLQTAAVNLTPVVAELGGKSANIIFDDADLDAAAILSAHQGPLMQSGQSCACASRVLVHESVYDAFLEKFVAVIEASTIGDPLDPQVVFGPVISQTAADRILGVIDEAVTDDVRDANDANLRTKPGTPMKVVDADAIADGRIYADYVEWRAKNPSDDLMTALLNVEFEDENGVNRKLTRKEVLHYTQVVAGAGNETTGRLIGWLAKVLAEHPDQRRVVLEDRSLLTRTVDETLRFEPTGPTSRGG